MRKTLGVIITCVLASLFLFPFVIKGTPANTKIGLAVAGLVVLGYELAKGQSAVLEKNISILSGLAIVVSFLGLTSIVLNNTPDYSYATYIFSMWVWLGAAYFIVKVMQSVHGRIDVDIICNYLIAVCVVQCIASIFIDRYPEVKDFVDRYIDQGQDFLNFLKNTTGANRKYGIGANLDVAGSRFSAVLIMIATLIIKSNEEKKTFLALFYFLCFIFISVQGNVIARTTSVGMSLGLGMVGIYYIRVISKPFARRGNFISIGFIVLFVMTAIVVYLYNTDQQFHKDMRFAFEGFFSLVESGTWNVSSNNKLETMYVWPESLMTWIIGDGYFSNPRITDPYFVGNVTRGYYMGTDVGYLRFIYYFGVLGLAAFSAFMCYAAKICMDAFKNYRLMFLVILLVNFIVWLKVSTDLFVVFAPFLVLSAIDCSGKEAARIARV